MAAIALVLDIVFLLLAFGGRTTMQFRRTGDTGWRIASAHSRAEALAHGCLALGVLLLGAAPIVAIATDGPSLPRAFAAIGVAGAVAAIVLVTVSQLQMGASWRIGVDPTEQTALVTSGVYRRIRNPIYTGIGLFGVSQLLLVPNFCSLAALVVIVVGVQVQVRRVEEPYLRRLHGDAFAHWAATAGRFLPTYSTSRAPA